MEADKGDFQGKAALSSSNFSCDTKADLEILFDGNTSDGKEPDDQCFDGFPRQVYRIPSAWILDS